MCFGQKFETDKKIIKIYIKLQKNFELMQHSVFKALNPFPLNDYFQLHKKERFPPKNIRESNATASR